MAGSLTLAFVISTTGSGVVGPELAAMVAWFGCALIADTSHWTASEPTHSQRRADGRWRDQEPEDYCRKTLSHYGTSFPLCRMFRGVSRKQWP